MTCMCRGTLSHVHVFSISKRCKSSIIKQGRQYLFRGVPCCHRLHKEPQLGKSAGKCHKWSQASPKSAATNVLADSTELPESDGNHQPYSPFACVACASRWQERASKQVIFQPSHVKAYTKSLPCTICCLGCICNCGHPCLTSSQIKTRLPAA